MSGFETTMRVRSQTKTPRVRETCHISENELEVITLSWERDLNR